MTTLLPTSQSTGVEAYEDMFKEITRKLYGDEATAHGLYPHNTQVAQLAPGAPSAPPDGGERSFTTLTQIGYDATTGTGQQQQQQQQQQHPQQSSGPASGEAFKAGEHISTAFGLAALMQGGFPPPGAILNPVNFPPGTSKTPTNISGPSSEDRWAGHHQQQTGPADEQGGPWHGGKHSAAGSSSYRGKSYKKPKTERHDGSSPGTAAGGLNIPSTADRSKGGSGNNGGGAGSGYSAGATAAAGAAASGVTPVKRYTCSSCPYTTDRRDLFTRHENIHKEEKPFQCYACLKPFNRADHVKKHFLRMHRELEYDIAKTRRYPPGTSSSASASSAAAAAAAGASSSGTKGGSYYSSAANGGAQASTITSTSSAASSSSLTAMPLNIPSSGSYTSGGGTGLSSHALDHHAVLNSSHSAHLLQLQQAHHQHQQQQQQQQQQHHHNVQTSPHALQSISVKQEKSTALLNTSGSSVGSGSGLGEDKSFPKKVKGEKKFSCAFCPWAGTDNWGLKRHLNTHTKPYVCLLCDYKAARSERLATHVFKVHNRKACGKCNFIADDQSQLDAHLHEAHPHEATKASNISNNTNTSASSNSNSGGKGAATMTHHHPLHHHHHHHHHHSQHLPPPVLPPPSVSGVASNSGSSSSNSNSSNSNAAVLRNLGNAFPSNNLPTNIPTTGNGFGNGPSNGHYHATNLHHAATGNVLTNSNAANLIDTINQHLAATTAAGSQHQQQQQQQQHLHNHHNRIAWRRRRGAELLYSYLEADGSDSGDYARLLHMQAVGRNKASVTQDFHNAGGGDYNGINGHASSPSSSPSTQATAMDKQKHGGNTDGSEGGGVRISAADGSAKLSSLASLLGGDQLSFLQLLATAAVAQQHLQLQSGQHNKKQQQQQQQQPHLIQPKQPSTTNGMVTDRHAPFSVPMASSPPATSTPHQQHNNSNSISNNTHSTNGGTLAAAQPLPLIKRRRTTNNELSNDKENLLYRKHHASTGAAAMASVIVNNTSLIANGVSIAVTASSLPTITNGRNGVKNGHHHHHHHNNNNNSSTNNKNINDIFDKVYKKPQSTFGKQQPILRTAPPSAIEEDGSGPLPPPPPPVATAGTDYTDPANQCGTEKFSLAEFLKNHTEVSISTVGGGAVTTGKDAKAGRTAAAPPPLSSPSLDDDEEGHDSSCSGSSSSSSSSSRKRKADSGERNPRKQQQPRRIDEFEVVKPVTKSESTPSTPAPAPPAAPRPMLKVLSPAEVVSKLEERKERKQKLSETEEEEKGKAEEPEPSNEMEKPTIEANTQESPSKLADIRDKHMIQLVTRRLCCRICQHKGALEHLDNCHYHSKISLLLHTRWRHQRGNGGGSRIRCHQCDHQFTRRYKLVLHQKLTGHKGTIEDGVNRKSLNGGGTHDALLPGMTTVSGEAQCAGQRDLPKKQRKRKPRSQCFTRRRK